MTVAITGCVIHVINIFYAKLDHLHLIATETNFGHAFTPKLATSPRRAYQLNPFVRRNSI